jgi:protein-tyrosine phosphatase
MTAKLDQLGRRASAVVLSSACQTRITKATTMIDLHCHILPGIDDGAGDMNDSVAMAEQAAADGIGTICATPHIRHDHDVRIHELASRVAQLNAELVSRGCEVEVVTGGEVAETALASLTDLELDQVSLGGRGRWILLEPAPGPLSDTLTLAVDHLAARGRRAVIAHPERHATQDLFQRLAEMISRGALVQATAALLVEGEAQSGMLEMAGAGAIHLLGSDSHSAYFGRPVALAAALERLAKVDPIAQNLDWVAREAPASVLAGDDVSPPFAITTGR